MIFLLKTLLAIDVLMAAGLLMFRWALPPQHRDVVSPKLFVLALLTPAVALFCGNIYLFCAYLAVVVAFNSRSRTELAGTYVFLLPLMPILSVETGVGSVYLLAISAVVAMNLGAMLAFLTSKSGKSLAEPRYDIAIVLLMGIFFFAAIRDVSATAILRELVVNILSFGAPYLLISRALRTRDDVERLLLKLTLGAVLVAVTALFQAVRHWILFQTYYQALGVAFPMNSWTLSLRGGLIRTGGSMLDYSSAGLFLAAIITLMPLQRGRFRPIGFWVILAVLIGGLVVSQSRGAWVSAIVGLAFVCAYRGLWVRMIVMAGGSAAAFVLVQLFATSGRLAAIAGKTDEASTTVTYRKQLFYRGLDQIEAHPLIGQSQQSLVANLQDLVQGQHIVDFVNSHLYVAMIAGVPALVLWLGIWLSPVVGAWKRRQTPGAGLAEAPAAIIVPIMVAIAATSVSERNLIWPTIALAIAGPCMALSGRRQGARSERRPLVQTSPSGASPAFVQTA